jgi:hypothetical protein
MDCTRDRSHFRSWIASIVQSPVLKFPFFWPRGAPGLRPPCSRQRLRPRMAGRWHGVPPRVLAPHRGACLRFRSLASSLWSIGLISKFSPPPPVYARLVRHLKPGSSVNHLAPSLAHLHREADRRGVCPWSRERWRHGPSCPHTKVANSANEAWGEGFRTRGGTFRPSPTFSGTPDGTTGPAVSWPSLGAISRIGPRLAISTATRVASFPEIRGFTIAS